MDKLTTIRYRKRLAITWFVGVGIIFLQILLQYFGGMYFEPEGSEQGFGLIPWIWFFTVTLPGSLVVASLFIWTKRLRRQIAPTFYKIIFIGVVVYLLIALGITFLSFKFSGPDFVYFIRDSKRYLLPLELLLAFLIIAGFYKKKGSHLTTDELDELDKIGVVDYKMTSEILKLHQEEMDTLINKSKAKISGGKPDKVFNDIIQFLKKIGIDDREIIHLQHRWNTIKRNHQSNFITSEEAETRQARVIAALLKLIKALKSQNS